MLPAKLQSQVTVEEYHPGDFSTQLTFYTPWFFGIDSESDQATILPEAYTGTRVNYDFVLFPVQINPAMMFDIQSQANTALDQLMQDLTPQAMSAPKLSIKGGQRTGVVGLNLSTTSKYFIFGIGYRELLYLDSSALWTGTSILLNIPSASGDVKVRMEPTTILKNTMEIKRTNMRLGFFLFNSLSLDIVAHYYDGYARTYSIADINATGSLSGNIESFNTDSHNSLLQSFNGNYRGNAIGGKASIAINQPDNNYAFKVSCEAAEPLKFKGSINSLMHTFPDPINTSDITATAETRNTINNPLEIRLPSFFSTEALFLYEKYKIGLGYKKFVSGLEIISNYFGNQSVVFKDSVGLSLTSPSGQLSCESINAENQAFFSFSLTISANLGNNWSIDQSLMAFPLQLLRSRVSYTF